MRDRFVNRQIYQAYSNKYSINTTGNNATGRKAYSPLSVRPSSTFTITWTE